jgi:deoxyribodipyrimidine photolyase
MTDEELVKALRWKAGAYAKQAADRIEQLVATNEGLCVLHREYEKLLTERIEELQQTLKDQSSVSDRLAEANEKLTAERDEHWKSFVHWRKEADALTEQRAKAVEAMEFWLQAQEPDFDAAIDLMQATLAELKGRPRG